MKKTYLCPEAELLCFTACEALAAVDWKTYQVSSFSAGGTDPSQVDVEYPSNPEGGFLD